MSEAIPISVPGFDDPVPQAQESDFEPEPEAETTVAPPRTPAASSPATPAKAAAAVGARRVTQSASEVDRVMRAQGLGATRIIVKRTGPSWLPTDERGYMETFELAELAERGVEATIREMFGGGKYLCLTCGPGDVEIEGEKFTVDISRVDPIVTTAMGIAALDRLRERKSGGQPAPAVDPASLMNAIIAAAKQMQPPPAPPAEDREKSLFQMMLDAQRQSEERIRAENDRRDSERKAEDARRDADRKAEDARREADRQAERERDRRDRDEREKDRQRQHEMEMKRLDVDKAREIERMRQTAKDPVAGIGMIDKVGTAMMDMAVKFAKARTAEPKDAAFDWREALIDLGKEVLPPLVTAFPQLIGKAGAPPGTAAPPIPSALPAPLARTAPPIQPRPDGPVPAGAGRPSAVAPQVGAGAQALPAPPVLSRGAAEVVPTTDPQTPTVDGSVPTTDPQVAPPANPIAAAAMAGYAATMEEFVGRVAVAQIRQIKPSRAWEMDDARLAVLLEELPEPMQDALAKDGWERFSEGQPQEAPGFREIAHAMTTDVGRDWMRRFLAEGPWTWPDDPGEPDDDETGDEEPTDLARSSPN